MFGISEVHVARYSNLVHSSTIPKREHAQSCVMKLLLIITKDLNRLDFVSKIAVSLCLGKISILNVWS